MVRVEDRAETGVEISVETAQQDDGSEMFTELSSHQLSPNSMLLN